MAKFVVEINRLETNDDGSATAFGSVDGMAFEAKSNDRGNLFKVGGSLTENSKFTRGHRIAIARACRKAVAIGQDEKITASSDGSQAEVSV